MSLWLDWAYDVPMVELSITLFVVRNGHGMGPQSARVAMTARRRAHRPTCASSSPRSSSAAAVGGSFVRTDAEPSACGCTGV